MNEKKKLFERMNSIGQMPINESMLESSDNEGSMYKVQLNDISQNAESFKNMIDDQEDLPAWVQDKIALADHYMDAITGWKESEQMGGEVNEDQSKFNVQELIPMLQKTYYQTGYFPVQNPDGSIKFIQNDQEFDAFLEKVQQSFSNLELPF
jgi:hypothetical protein